MLGAPPSSTPEGDKDPGTVNRTRPTGYSWCVVYKNFETALW